jgi:prophage regulatory protein
MSISTNPSQLYRIADLATTKGKTGILPVAPASIWRWVADGNFPQPFSIGKRCTVWSAADVEAWLSEQQSAPQQAKNAGL